MNSILDIICSKKDKIKTYNRLISLKSTIVPKTVYFTIIPDSDLHTSQYILIFTAQKSIHTKRENANQRDKTRIRSSISLSRIRQTNAINSNQNIQQRDKKNKAKTALSIQDISNYKAHNLFSNWSYVKCTRYCTDRFTGPVC